MTAISSDWVILFIKGRTISGASVWPTKILAETLNVSEPLVPIVFCIALAIHFTINWIIPKWYKTDMRAEKKIIVGNARNAKFISAVWKPTSGTKDVKRKSPPASEKLISFEIALSKNPNRGLPIGVFNINRANMS